MTAVATTPRLPRWSGRLSRLAGRRRVAVDVPSLSDRSNLIRSALVVLFVVSACLLLDLAAVSSVQQRATQQQLFDRFRAELAAGTAPLGPTDVNGRELALGSPVAHLEIPSVGLRQVVVEGSTGGILSTGPGHRRDSPLPGQAGVSIVLGRRAAYGGPFARIHELEPGSVIRTTTGQGTSTFRVSGVRREGDPVPDPVKAGEGRLLLATADGSPFLPDGVLRVDAELDGRAQAGPPRLVSTQTLPSSEQMMAADSSLLWALALWLQALVVIAVASVWAWHRWGRAHAWVVFLPPLLLVGLNVSNHTAQLLPNLL